MTPLCDQLHTVSKATAVGERTCMFIKMLGYSEVISNAKYWAVQICLHRPLRLDKWGLLREQGFDVHFLLFSRPLTGVEGYVECRYDDQRQQGGESHTTNDHPRHTGPELGA